MFWKKKPEVVGTSAMGQTRKSGDAIATSDLPLKADLADQARHVGFVPILL